MDRKNNYAEKRRSGSNNVHSFCSGYCDSTMEYSVLVKRNFRNVSVSSAAEYFVIKEFPHHELRKPPEKTSFEATSLRILEIRKKSNWIKTKSNSCKTDLNLLLISFFLFVFWEDQNIKPTNLASNVIGRVVGCFVNGCSERARKKTRKLE